MKRDISTINLRDKELIITVDNIGGVGNKEHDVVNADYQTISYYGARTALMENISAGALPLAVNIINFCGDNNWDSIVKGVQQASKELEINIIINGSTESNFEMIQSALGISVIGEKLQKSVYYQDCSYAVIGEPLVGNEVIQYNQKMISLSEFNTLSKLDYVIDILPVGSKGIKKEFQHFLDSNIECELDIVKSGGPSTCVIVSYKKGEDDKLLNIFGDKFYKINLKDNL